MLRKCFSALLITAASLSIVSCELNEREEENEEESDRGGEADD